MSVFKSASMCKFRIIIPKDYYYRVKFALINLKTLHLDAWWDDEEFVDFIKEHYIEGEESGKEIDIKSLSKLHNESDKFKRVLENTQNLIRMLGLEAESLRTISKEIKIDEDYLTKLEDKLSLLDSKIKEASKLIEGEEKFSLKDKLYEIFPNYESILSEAKYVFEMILDQDDKVFHGDFLTYMFGWVPEDRVNEVIETLNRVTDNSVVISISHPSKHDHPPFLSKSPKALKPFESLIKTYDIPSPHELNPTIIVSITFPMLFGLAFADIGHGLLLAIFGVFSCMLKRKGFSGGEMVNLVLSGAELYLLCGIAAIFGGLMFGEIFGFHIHHPPLEFILKAIPGIGRAFSPLKEPMKMFKLSLMVGMIHISLGLILSMINDILEGEYKKAIFGSACWLWFYLGLMYLGLFVYKLNMDKWISGYLTIPLVVLPVVLMLIGMILTEGPIDGFAHTFEAAISSLSHTVSYGRILALSLSHGMLSQLLSSVIPALGAAGYIILAIGTITLIMALEGLVSFTHVLRLTWVEFGFKYFRGGGEEYKPLGIK
ncbi:MAG: V-type ATPase 116kDa subunit family protein [Nitrososphaerota archaeon]|nr:V-type ATPase 116kDa subunit family protein [Nitrososphaerota archaeon]